MTSTRAHRDGDDDVRQVAALAVVSFAGIMLLLTAVLQLLEGVAAIADDDVFIGGADYVYSLDVTTWGWVHVVLGVIGIATAAGIMTRQLWGQVLGIGIAVTGAVLSFAFLPYFPLWTLVVIALDVLVIWALCDQIADADPL